MGYYGFGVRSDNCLGVFSYSIQNVIFYFLLLLALLKLTKFSVILAFLWLHWASLGSGYSHIFVLKSLHFAEMSALHYLAFLLLSNLRVIFGCWSLSWAFGGV